MYCVALQCFEIPFIPDYPSRTQAPDEFGINQRIARMNDVKGWIRQDASVLPFHSIEGQSRLPKIYRQLVDYVVSKAWVAF